MSRLGGGGNAGPARTAGGNAGPARTTGADASREDRRLPDGRRPVAGAVLLRADGAVLLQHRDDVPGISHPGLWSLFGGGIEPGESPLDGMLREISEEIGVRLSEFRPLVVLEGARTVFHVYLARLEPPLEELTLSEGQGMAFLELATALAAYDLAPVARTALEITSSLLAMRRLEGLDTPFDGWS